MMKKIIAPTAILATLLLGACAQTRDYAPTVDTRASNPAATANYDRDLQECKDLATQAAGNTATEAAIGAGVGGAIGAGTGAIVGAVADKNVGTAAMIGAAAGGVAGAAKQGFESDSKYKKTFRDCMRSRGHNVID
jgi:outer membrane lipoprotein SlyB